MNKLFKADSVVMINLLQQQQCAPKNFQLVWPKEQTMQRPICSQAQRRARTLSNNRFLCEVATFITVSMTEEETSRSMSRMQEICSCFSPYTSCWAIPPLPPPSPAAFTVSLPTIWLLSHPQVLLISLAPQCHLQNAFKAYSISPGAVILPSFVGLASQAQCLVPHCLSALPGLSKESFLGCSGFSSSEGH